jgi:peroxiredoxin Q/BCP
MEQSIKKAPSFTLPDQNGVLRSLNDYLGKWVLLYFYPKDDTPGCTKEACGFRDIADQYSKNGIVVIGISKDSVTSHMKFAEKYHLTYTLLSDESKKVIESYGAWGEKKFMGKSFTGVKRISFLIDPQQKIRKSYLSVNPFTHANSVLADYISLNE